MKSLLRKKPKHLVLRKNLIFRTTQTFRIDLTKSRSIRFLPSQNTKLIYRKFNAAISSLNRYEKRLSLDDSAISRDAVRFNEFVKTKTSSYASSIESLSGGNRQKVIISRSLMKDLDILIFDEPTRGIDIGAKEDIYEIIKALAAEGHSVIVISSETDEIRSLCDRVLVMYEGTVAGELEAGNVTSENIMRLATGAADQLEENS